jgi:hypothetical protein
MASHLFLTYRKYIVTPRVGFSAGQVHELVLGSEYGIASFKIQ